MPHQNELAVRFLVGFIGDDVCTPCMEYSTPLEYGVWLCRGPRQGVEYGVLALSGGMGVWSMEYGVWAGEALGGGYLKIFLACGAQI